MTMGGGARRKREILGPHPLDPTLFAHPSWPHHFGTQIFLGLGPTISGMHLHPKTISSTDSFIRMQFHPMNIHPKTVSSQFTRGTINIVRISVQASPVEVGDVPHEGVLKVEKREFRCLGSRGLRFWCSGIQVFRCLGHLNTQTPKHPNTQTPEHLNT